jgi:hypothetical protein
MQKDQFDTKELMTRFPILNYIEERNFEMLSSTMKQLGYVGHTNVANGRKIASKTRYFSLEILI